MAIRWGLRGKSALALLLASLIALVPAALIGWQAIDDVRRHFANAYAENYTLLHMQRILAPVTRELALSQRFANSLPTRRWLANEADTRHQADFLEEAEGYRQDFSDHAYFVVANDSGNYYFNEAGLTGALRPSYRLSADDPDDRWYFHSIESGEPYNINVNVDTKLGVTKVWFNVVVRDTGRVLGMAGSGLDLSGFLDDFIRGDAQGITPMIADRRGALQAYPDTQRIAFSSGAGAALVDREQRVQSLLDTDAQREALSEVMQQAEQMPGTIQTLQVTLDGRPKLLSVGYMPTLDWLMITALDIQAAQVIDPSWLWGAMLGLVLLLTCLLLAFIVATNRLIITPLRHLQQSTQAIAGGDYSPRLPVHRHDEIGELSRAFSCMAGQVAQHTQQLEAKVHQRTRELEQANVRMAWAQRQIEDSLEYASIIQRAILPVRQIANSLEHHYGVLWRPRDRVGGDFYVFRATPRGYLLGVVDCAGHGVPGALMTMLARAAIDHAILEVGEDDPAGILNATDRLSRELLQEDALPSTIATNMDIGLVWVDRLESTLTFAGAKMSLYASDGRQLEIQRGAKRAIAQKRRTTYSNITQPLYAGWTYTLCTDGFLDQAGGEHGFGFGTQRFEAMLIAHAQLSPARQVAMFEAELDAYQGELPQRDDITVLSFRFHAAHEQDGARHRSTSAEKVSPRSESLHEEMP
ncbi:biofilm regulation protein phosphatase SiaA [Halomonas sp. McH1-25]|uniref:biofilm regulation protein phosphatase SiaA n=1 Tax=unclassified Halomonas TaxID=2609666 RepID=UPI001EF67105|nr:MULTISPECIES: biofilm regulation protein phosphatase SiaA [unclassified Halomonas]MCG7600991.1 biofilm regulation protein phosphatase SiaA [Halomonas sp. McH1-25]MCP1342082.1 biofilm regulation protein phosphatase SiaA [Halomonas sp. FL8]MCP1359736.1 biofilm regulation protein phosphatase SiaA [Halomonas sp. BBD45]MCP1365521.1 biofilm regulation protein phosphatase SiaA [Halomonas sp. BBD48]